MTQSISRCRIRGASALKGTTLLTSLAALALTSPIALAQSADTVETITVTGYRASLESSTIAKKGATTFSETVFAEDIGKFPDSNIAESFNRIPGVHISRDIDGEGVNISVRGLGPSFTKIMLNGAPVAVASTGSDGSQNQNREVDLNMFPTDLFSKLTVEKSPRASMEEGGIAGVVDMRQARPFDNPGTHVSFNLQGNYSEKGGSFGPRGTLIASYTDGPWGLLVGLAGNSYNFKITGYETVGYTTPTWVTSWCATGETCNSNGSNNWTIPDTVPSTAAGLTAGTSITAAYLQSLNPSVTTAQISDALMPRLPRYSYEQGSRDRYNGIISAEYRPSDALQFYTDMQVGRTFNDMDRTDVDLCVRNCRAIPTNMKVDANGVVTSVDLTNVSWMLEARPYTENQDFIGLNPGMKWDITDKLKFSAQANYTRSHFFRSSPTFMVVTDPSDLVTMHYETTSSGIPKMTTNVDLNDPSTYTWYANGATGYQNGRVNLQAEKRYTFTKGLHGEFEYGGDELNVKVGGAYDDTYRSIKALDNTTAWQTYICGDGVSSTCAGTSAAAIPNTALSNYLVKGSNGFVTFDYAKAKKASNYYSFLNNAPAAKSSNTSASTGIVQELTKGFYVEANGDETIFDGEFRYNAGLRWVETDQLIAGPQSASSYEISNYAWTHNTYQAFLPSLNLMYSPLDNLQIRFAASRTMTRPNPSAMLPSVTFSDPSAAVASLGNPDLTPYYSDNFDLGAEYYTGGEGYVGVTAFEKQMSGFTYTGYVTKPFSYMSTYGITYATLTDTQKAAITALGGVDYASVTISTQLNSKDMLTMKGVEFTWVQPLDFLLERYGLKGFGYSANATFLDQKGSSVSQASDVPAYTYNVTAYYEQDGLMVRGSYTFTAGAFQGYNGNGATVPTTGKSMGIYSDDYGQMDISASYKLGKLLGEEIPADPDLTFSAQNVLAAHQRQYEQYTNATYQYWNQGAMIMFGVRGSY